MYLYVIIPPMDAICQILIMEKKNEIDQYKQQNRG